MARKQKQKIQEQGKQSLQKPQIKKAQTATPVVTPPAPTSTPTYTKRFFHLRPLEIGGIIFAVVILFSMIFASAFTLGLYGNDLGPVQATTVVPTNTNAGVVQEKPETTEMLDGAQVPPTQARYPIAVMFDNHSSARPQSHLQNASIVYETLVEGSITRFMGIFDHGDEDKIGPVRSSRPYFVQWLDAFDAGYMHAGGSPEALQKIRELGVKDMNQGPYYWRDSGRPSPHNLFTSSAKQLLALHAVGFDKKEKTFGTWTFSDDPKNGPTATTKVDLYFSDKAEGSHVSWTYDASKKWYLRSQAGVVHKDAATNEQLHAKTVIVEEILPIVAIGDHGRLTLNVLGTNKAHIIFNGQRFEGTWKKASTVDRDRFYDEAGTEIVFPRGNIFIEVIPNNKPVTFE